jgi:hypothetical protein
MPKFLCCMSRCPQRSTRRQMTASRRTQRAIQGFKHSSGAIGIFPHRPALCFALLLLSGVVADADSDPADELLQEASFDTRAIKSARCGKNISRIGESFDLPCPTTRSMVGTLPASGRLTIDHGIRFFTQVEMSVTPRR